MRSGAVADAIGNSPNELRPRRVWRNPLILTEAAAGFREAGRRQGEGRYRGLTDIPVSALVAVACARQARHGDEAVWQQQSQTVFAGLETAVHKAP